MEKRSVTSKIRSELRVADETESFHFQDNVHVEAVIQAVNKICLMGDLRKHEIIILMAKIRRLRFI